MQSQILTEFVKGSPKLRFNQGDILKDISFFIGTGEDLHLLEINLKYAIVISQECDLEHDYNTRAMESQLNQDKFLPNVLVLPAYLSDNFRQGKHRGEDIKGEEWKSTEKWNVIQRNNNPRFHTIKESQEFQIPNLVLDFKHLYSIDREEIYRKKEKIYLASICELYRELISQRYSNYLGRIGLPDKTTI